MNDANESIDGIDPAGLVWEFKAIRPLNRAPHTSTERHVFAVTAQTSNGKQLSDKQIAELGGIEVAFHTEENVEKAQWHALTPDATVPGQWHILVGPDSDVSFKPGARYRIIRSAFKPKIIRMVDTFGFGF